MKGMKKYFAILMATLMLLVLVAACGDDSSGGDGDGLKHVMLLGSNFGDRSFFDSAAGGIALMDAQLSDYVTTEIVDVGPDTTVYTSAVLDASDQNPDIIIVGTFNMNTPVREAAPANPDINYIIFDDAIDDLDNVYSILFKVNEGSFLAGMIGAEASESGIIGFVGGMDNTPIIWDFLVGYILGAQYINPDIQVIVAYTNDFTDPARGKELALAMINNNGADVLFGVAGLSGMGVIEAGAESGVWVIGVDGDQAAQYEGRPEQEWIISSSLKNVNNAIFYAVQRTVVDGTFPAGHDILGLEQGAVGVVIDDNTRRVVGQEFIDKVLAAEEEIRSGSRQVASAWDISEAEVAAIVASAS